MACFSTFETDQAKTAQVFFRNPVNYDTFSHLTFVAYSIYGFKYIIRRAITYCMGFKSASKFVSVSRFSTNPTKNIVQTHQNFRLWRVNGG